MDDNNKIKQDFLFDIIKRYDHYIGTTNFKVGLMLSFLVTVILGLAIRAMTVEKLPTSNLIITIITLTIISALFAIIQLFRAVFPNTNTISETKSLIFFGDVASAKNGANGYYKKVMAATDEQITKDIATQAFVVAEIVNEKFRILKIAVNTIYCAVLPLLTITLVILVIAGGK